MGITGDLIELREEEIRTHYTAAAAMLQGFDHVPRLAKATAPAETTLERSPGLATRRRFRSTTPGLVVRPDARSEGVHLIDRISVTNGDDPLLSPLQAMVQTTLRRALAIALTMGAGFARQTDLTALKKSNLEGALRADKRTEFGELLTAEALISLSVFGNATSFLLAPHMDETGVEIGSVDEVLTDNGQLALHGALWALDQKIAVFAGEEPKLIATVTAFAEQLMEKVALRAQTASRLEPFTTVSHRVEADDFTVNGFVPARRAQGSALAMTFKKPNEVVGNHIAKHQAMKLAKMLMAYDFQRKLNPFAELGGFIFTFMGDGKPGTGKTTLIQMMAGLISDYCRVAHYPFRYRNLSTDNIDSYQGRSGQNAKNFIDYVTDPNVIGFGTIDDIDQLAGKRGDRQSSAGQLEITAVLMDGFAGADTVVRGNCTFGMFSNYPENVDDALRQRAGGRFLVNGPQTREDYIDILHLLLGDNHSIPMGEHTVFAAQDIKKAVATSFENHSRPHEERLTRVYERMEKDIGRLDTIAKLGTYLKRIQEADARFTGRAVKNITDAIKVRAMDFELPDEWMDNPELFLFKPYEEKKAMITELRQPITVEMIIQEINRYADSEFRYADKSDEAAIVDAIREMGRMEEAKRRYMEQKR